MKIRAHLKKGLQVFILDPVPRAPIPYLCSHLCRHLCRKMANSIPVRNRADKGCGKVWDKVFRSPGFWDGLYLSSGLTVRVLVVQRGRRGGPRPRGPRSPSNWIPYCDMRR